MLKLSRPGGLIYMDAIGRKIRLLAKATYSRIPVYLGVIVSEGEIETELFYEHELRVWR